MEKHEEIAAYYNHLRYTHEMMIKEMNSKCAHIKIDSFFKPCLSLRPRTIQFIASML
jgi:hypothetical protein